MSKFKVGDRVDTRGDYSFDPGRGTVVKAYAADDLYYVEMDGEDGPGCDPGWAYTSKHLTAVAVATATATPEHKFKVGDVVNNGHHNYTVAELVTKYGNPAVEYESGGWDPESSLKLVHRDATTELTVNLDLEFIPFPQVGDAVLIPGWIAGITNSARGTNYNIVFETQNRRVSLHFLEEDFIVDDDDGECVCANNDNDPVRTGDRAKAFDALGDWLRAVAINPSAAFRSNKEAA